MKRREERGERRGERGRRERRGERDRRERRWEGGREVWETDEPFHILDHLCTWEA